ncbi:acyltransferase [Klenkia sp. PcliD-1-E]|uniref:acyltransferase family protein n=1 Tax=Klenkia sp. PcliD-1-E TaxID=2954492 RepID=UPI0027E10E98|nr:acyltransferase [Klenkia sp. PcliD-1-E]
MRRNGLPRGTQDTRPARPGPVPALTGLRAVAALWVVLLHLQIVAGPYLDQLPLLRPVIGAGWTGVELFFVLSGFVLTWNYLDELGRPTPRRVGLFVWNRFARVWPAWAAVTAVAGAWLWVMRSRGADADVVSAHPASGLPELMRQLTMTQQWGHAELGGASFVPPGWSVSAEWAAYLAFPLLVLAAGLLRRLPAAVLLVGAVAALAPRAVLAFEQGVPDSEQNWLARLACGFTAGMLTALAVRRAQGWRRGDQVGLVLTWSAVGGIAAGAAWAAWLTWSEGPSPTPTDHYGVVVVLFPLLVAGLALTARGPARWLSSGSMQYAGRVSYCLYLVHFTVIEAVLSLWWTSPADLGTLHPGLVLAVPGILAGSALLAVGLHHLVEEPARRYLVAAVRRRPAPTRPVERPTEQLAAIRIPHPVALDHRLSAPRAPLPPVPAVRA